jgi:hypothetical protein
MRVINFIVPLLLFSLQANAQTINTSRQRYSLNTRITRDTTPTGRVYRPQYTNRVNMDTAPAVINKYKRINTVNSRYKNEVVKVYRPVFGNNTPYPANVPAAEAATPDDSLLLALSVNNVLTTIRNNYTPDIDSYVDTTKELYKVCKLYWGSRKVYRRDVSGLTKNIMLLDNIFKKSSFDTEDIEMISFIFSSNDSLIQNIKLSNYQTIMSAAGPIELTIIDSTNNPVPFATCYFINKPVWRGIENSKNCEPNPVVVNCNQNILPELEQKSGNGKLNYNTNDANGKKISLSYGPYHLLILENGSIRFHEVLSFDVNTGLTKTIKLNYGR